MKIKKLLLAAPLVLAAACGGTPVYTQPPYAPITPQAYQICLGPNGQRVLDLFCDSPHLGYYPDYYSGSSVLLPAVGYAPVGPGWSRTRPNVTNITIHNHEPVAGGRVTADPPKPPASTTPSKPAVTPVPSKSSSIQRGGLGVPSVSKTR